MLRLFRSSRDEPPPPIIGSKEVNRAIRQVVWASLKDEGFERRTARTAWRDRPDQVEVVNFQSFNAYIAGALNVTSFSFQVNLGIFPRCMFTPAVKVKDGKLRPDEYVCDFRRVLSKRLSQPETKDATTFYVAADGSNLDEVVADAHRAITTDGLTWFARLDGFEALLKELQEAPESMKDGTWGMGNFGSPHRRELTAALKAAVAAR